MDPLKLVTKSDCQKMVSKDWKGGKFEVVDYQVKPIGGDLTGFLSVQFKLKVTAKEIDGGRLQQFDYFIKCVPIHSPSRTEFVRICGVYEREELFYSEILFDLKTNDISEEEVCNCVPTFYLAKKDLIIMEDLAEKGYSMIGCRTELGLEHCRLVLKALANFHAATVIYEERKKKEDPNFVSICDNPRYQLDDALHAPVHINGEGLEWIKGSFGAFTHLVRLIPKYRDDEDLCRRICQKLPVVYQTSLDLVRRSDRFRNVVCHGDLWSNNIMFRHDGAGKPDRVKFLDYQFVRYLPPASDIMVFLHSTTRRQLREDNEEDLLRLYYNQLTHTLTTHGLSQDLLPEEEFSYSCDQMRQLGRIMSAVYSTGTLLPGEYLPTEEENMRFSFIDKGPEVCRCYHSDEIFRERVTEIMEEFIDYCVIPLL